jgi:hypothetical protein
MSTLWIVITAADLDDALVGAKASAIRTAALASGQADRFDNVMHARSNYVRNRIAGRCSLSATAYAVPPELKTQTCLLIIEQLQTVFPSLRLSDDQKNTISRAYKDLDIAGTVDFPISTATDAAAADVSIPGPSITGKTRYYDSTAEDGI